MIERVLAAVRGRVQGADVFWQQGERTAVAFEAGRLKSCGTNEESGTNLRVLADGRVGVAGTTGDDVADLVRRAAASAQLGQALPLVFPAEAPYPAVETCAGPVADASLDRLVELGRELLGRVAREGCQVNVSVERSVAETRVATTAGANGAYQSTGLAVSVDVTRIAGDDVLMVYDYWVGVGWPAATDLDALVASVNTRLELALTVVEPPEGSLPVIFTPAGLSAILLPLEQGLSGKSVLQGVSPLGGKVGQPLFDERLSLSDDPLVAGCPASRPFDDEGVPSRRLLLIDRGSVGSFVYDLETAARAGVSSTGHGSRGTFRKPRISYTNLVVGGPTGGVSAGGLGGGLCDGIADGLIVDDLIGVGQGNVIGGAFSHPVALCYRVQRGTITGRVKDAAVAGNVYDLLRRIGGFGSDGRWYGSRWTPSLLLEGVSVARR